MLGFGSNLEIVALTNIMTTVSCLQMEDGYELIEKNELSESDFIFPTRGPPQENPSQVELKEEIAKHAAPPPVQSSKEEVSLYYSISSFEKYILNLNSKNISTTV